MNSFLRIAIVITAAAALPAVRVSAQAVAGEPGLIGKRYAGFDYSYDHFSGTSIDHAHGVGGFVNLPVSAKADLGFCYTYSDAEGGASYGAIAKALSGSYLVHEKTPYGTGYFAATIGHGWNRVTTAGVEQLDNRAFWGARTGYEIPVGEYTAVNAGISYSDPFKGGNSLMRFYVEANHWFSRDIAGVLSAGYKQIEKSPDAVSYTFGLRWAF